LEEDNKENNSNRYERPAAVALKGLGLEEGEMPKILASGYGKWAEKIVRLAFDNGVKVREDKELVQILAALDEEGEIPSEALIAVAEILAYVYRVNKTYKS